MRGNSRLRLQFETIQDLELALEQLPAVLGQSLSVAPEVAHDGVPEAAGGM